MLNIQCPHQHLYLLICVCKDIVMVWCAVDDLRIFYVLPNFHNKHGFIIIVYIILFSKKIIFAM